MSNAMYARGLLELNDALDWTASPFAVALVTPSIVYNPNDRFLSDIPTNQRLGSASVTGKASVLVSTNAVATAASTIVTLSQTGVLGAAVLYSDTGTESTSALLAYIDEIIGVGSQLSLGVNYVIPWRNASDGGVYTRLSYLASP